MSGTPPGEHHEVQSSDFLYEFNDAMSERSDSPAPGSIDAAFDTAPAPAADPHASLLLSPALSPEPSPLLSPELEDAARSQMQANHIPVASPAASLLGGPGGQLGGSPGSSGGSEGGSNGSPVTSPALRPDSHGLPQLPQGIYSGPVSITVGSPQKVTEGASAFVAYLVTSSRANQQDEHVRRRFSDFVKLYNQLAAAYPGCAVPPLPDHSRLEYIAGDRFKDEFTSKRAVSLERFLFRLLQHPELCRSRALAAFLTPKGHMAARGNARPSDASVIDTLSDHLLNAFAKVRYQSKEMLEAKDRADRFEHNVGSIDKAFSRMTRHQADLVSEMNDMHQQSTRLALLEKNVRPELELLSGVTKEISGATATLHTAMDATFAGALRDMTHYVQAIKHLLKQREQRQIDYEALVDYLQRTEADKAALQAGTTSTTTGFLRTKVNDLRGVDNEQHRVARLTRLDERITSLKSEVARAKQVSQQFEEVAKREVAVFEATEALEMKACLSSIADAHIAYYSSVLGECRRVEGQY